MRNFILKLEKRENMLKPGQINQRKRINVKNGVDENLKRKYMCMCRKSSYNGMFVRKNEIYVQEKVFGAFIKRKERIQTK